MKIGLGTVQFGLDYGISNVRGRTPAGDVRRILETARRRGVEVIDTAAQYGDAEEVLGTHLDPGHGFRIVTKTPSFAGRDVVGAGEADKLESTFHRSLSRLRTPAVYGLLLHRVDDLFAPDGGLLLERMADLKARGLVEKIGASVYGGAQIDRLMTEFRPDIVQVPLSLIDQRLVAGGQLARLAAAGIEVHARSVFLQGLLMLDPDRAPAYFAPWRDHLRACRARIADAGTTPLRAALAFVRGLPGLSTAVCGAADAAEFAQVLDAAEAPAPDLDVAAFALADEGLVNPVNWSRA